MLNSQGELTPAQEFVLSRRNDFGVAATSPSDLVGIFSTAGAMLAVAAGRLFVSTPKRNTNLKKNSISLFFPFSV